MLHKVCFILHLTLHVKQEYMYWQNRKYRVSEYICVRASGASERFLEVFNSFTVKKVSFFTINVKFKVILSSKSGGMFVQAIPPPKKVGGGGGYIPPIPPGFTPVYWSFIFLSQFRSYARLHNVHVLSKSSICKSVWYQLRNLGFIRKYFTRSPAEKIVHALISSRLDFGNALLYNLPQTKLAKIQRFQNAAARIVTLTRKYTHVTPILKSLHWLPIEQRIKF